MNSIWVLFIKNTTVQSLNLVKNDLTGHFSPSLVYCGTELTYNQCRWLVKLILSPWGEVIIRQKILHKFAGSHSQKRTLLVLLSKVFICLFTFLFPFLHKQDKHADIMTVKQINLDQLGHRAAPEQLLKSIFKLLRSHWSWRIRHSFHNLKRKQKLIVQSRIKTYIAWQ